MAAAAPHSAPAIPRTCGDCGYSLGGLPPSGRCPECGGAYPEGQIVLFGWGTGGYTNPHSMWMWPFLAAFAIYCGYDAVAHPEDREAYYPLNGIGWLAIAAFQVAMGYRARRRSHLGRPSQVRLGPAGFAQRDELGSASPIPWAADMAVDLKPSRHGRWRLRIRGSPVNVLGFALRSTRVDFMFEADEGLAAAVRQHIDWCRAHADAEIGEQ